MQKRKPYRLIEGTAADGFYHSRHKIQLMGGGFANGKTTALCIKALEIAKSYPGCAMMLGRATYPKLNKTLRREFFKWCPKKWIESFNKTDNELKLVNGTTIDFRYIRQKTDDSSGEGKSNVLSANYDFIGIDQADDPEIEYKDFLDMLGRLRGSAEYIGDDPTMPRSGPRWLCITANPTRNWLYRKIVYPVHVYKQTGRRHEDLLVDEHGEPIIGLYEASTYDNKDNLPPDYIATLEATYQGQMRSRYLEGKWEAFEGLVYPQFDQHKHVVPHRMMENYLADCRKVMTLEWIEGYDHGIAVPSCYLLAFVDNYGRVHIIDGIYEAEYSIAATAAKIDKLRRQYLVDRDADGRYAPILADPQIFRRSAGGAKVVGATVADMFAGEGIDMTRGNNNILNGITKVSAYLHIDAMRRDPYTGNFGAPLLYVSDKLSWWIDEITDYFWKRDSATGEVEETPMDRRDHAMDATKYMMSHRPEPAQVIYLPQMKVKPFMRWGERDIQDNYRTRRFVA
jgi:hypothetical protein